MLASDYTGLRRYLHISVFTVVLIGTVIAIASKWDNLAALLPYAVVGALSAGTVLMLWRYPRSLRWVEYVICGTLLTLNVGALYYDLFVDHNHVGELVYWVVLCYVMAFVVFRPRTGVMLCAGLVLLKLGMTVYHVLTYGESLAPFTGFYASQVVAIVLYYFLSHTIEQQRRQIVRLADTDFLTGLFNRRHLYNLVRAEVDRAQRYGLTFSVLLFDIDDFKLVNDEHGHSVGDQVLTAVADLVARDVRSTDRVGRWGGEEFIVFLPNTGTGQAAEIAERLRELIAGQVLDGVGTVTASFGVATYRPGDTPETLLKRADDSMYLAKEGGRNRVTVGEVVPS